MTRHPQFKFARFVSSLQGFAAPLKPLQIKALHTTSMEYVPRHIPSSTFRNVSVVLVTFTAYHTRTHTFLLLKRHTQQLSKLSHIALWHTRRNYCLHHEHIAQHRQKLIIKFSLLANSTNSDSTTLKLCGRDEHTSYSFSKPSALIPLRIHTVSNRALSRVLPFDNSRCRWTSGFRCSRISRTHNSFAQSNSLMCMSASHTHRIRQCRCRIRPYSSASKMSRWRGTASIPIWLPRVTNRFRMVTILSPSSTPKLPHRSKFNLSLSLDLWRSSVCSRKISWSSTNLLLAIVSNVEPWNRFNSSTWTSRRSQFCFNNCSWRIWWSCRRRSSAWARWSSSFCDSLVSFNFCTLLLS